MNEYETIREYEQDGWHIAIALAPDYDYSPGEDDDTYPVIEWTDWGRGTDPDKRDYDGQFLPQPIIVSARSGAGIVTPEEIERLITVGGMNRRTARKWIAETAAAIAGEDLSWAIVRVTATCGGATGTDYLGGVEYDLRESPPEKYALETVELYAMVETAILEAARAKVGGDAPLALGY